MDDYMRVHHVLHLRKLHIWWNLFRKPHRDYGIRLYKCNILPPYHNIAIYFGIGEFIIGFG